jgi:hypothetical protein
VSWRNKIREGKYTAPSGKEFIFGGYEKVTRDTELKTGTFTFPSRDGARVQHHGAGARTFPLVCVFSGEACMDDADAFEAALLEREDAELQHPAYGTVKVKPTGHIVREDDLVSALNESTVTVTFTEVITDEAQEAPNEVAADAVEEKYDEFSEAAAADFAEALAGVESLEEQALIEAALEAQVQTIIDDMEPLAVSNKKSFVDWLASVKELKDRIKGLYHKAMGIVGKVESTYVKALNIARLTLRLMKLPSTLIRSLSEKIQGYTNLTVHLINQYRNDPFGLENIKNSFAAAKLALEGAMASIASGAAISTAEAAADSSAGFSPGSARRSMALVSGGSVQAGGGGTAEGGSEAGRGSETGTSGDADTSAAEESPRNAGTSSREEAVEAAQAVMELMDTISSFEDTKTARINTTAASAAGALAAPDVYVDSASTSFMALSALVYQSVQLILSAGFALPMQRIITLDRDRQVIELCAELYGSIDYLDDFIIQNNFTIDEIELLPMDTRVLYYVQNA